MKSQKVSLMSTLMIPVAVAINVIGGQLTNFLKLPFYLDSIGTILMSCIAGPFFGIGTAVLSTLFNSLLRPQAFPFVLTAIGIALFSSWMAKAKMFNSLPRVLIVGICLNFLSVFISAPIVVYLFGGITGTGTSIVTGMLLATGKQLFASVATSGLAFGIIDKTVSCIVVYKLLHKMPKRSLTQFPQGNVLLKEGIK